MCFWQILRHFSSILAANRYPTPLAFEQHSVTFANIVVFRSGRNVDFGQPFRHCSLLFGWPAPFLGTAIGHLRSSFWSNPPAVLLNSHFHNLCKSRILNSTPTLSASLCYWPFALEVYFEATLYQFCKIQICTSSRGSVILKNTPSLLATLCYRPLPWEVYFWTRVHEICRIMFFATSCGSVVLNNTPSLFATLCCQPFPREV